MANLKLLKNRIKSVESTKKITQVMKMVSAAKLHRMQSSLLETATSYLKLRNIINNIVAPTHSGLPRIITGNDKDEVYLFVVIGSDRGLCGSFNNNLVKFVRHQVQLLPDKKVKFICIGNKIYDTLKLELEVAKHVTFGRDVQFSNAKELMGEITSMFECNEFDKCYVCYNKFHSIMLQEPEIKMIIPFQSEDTDTTFEYESEFEGVFDMFFCGTILPYIT